MKGKNYDYYCGHLKIFQNANNMDGLANNRKR